MIISTKMMIIITASDIVYARSSFPLWDPCKPFIDGMYGDLIGFLIRIYLYTRTKVYPDKES